MARNTLIDFLYNSREDLVSKVAQIQLLICPHLCRKKKHFFCSGGSTPGPIFDKLCEQDLNWKDISG